MAWNEALNQARVSENLRLGWLKVIEAFLRFLERIANDRNMSFKADRTAIDAVNALKEHVERGGSLKSSLIDTKDAQMFKDCLKYNHVAYSCSEMLTDTGETKMVFTTRDKDSDLVQKAVDMLVTELGTGLSKLPAWEFLNRTKDTKIEKRANLTEVEAFVFQKKLASYDITFSFNRVSEDSYEMLYLPQDADIVKEAALSVAFDLSGEVGQEYSRNLRIELDKERDFDKAIDHALKERARDFGHTGEKLEDMPAIYIVDSRNPNNFIAVTEDGFSTHSLHNRESVDSSGEVEDFVDDVSTVYKAEEKQTLMEYVNQLEAPVIIRSLAELGFIGGFHNHSLTLLDPDTTKERLAELIEQLKDRKDAYKRERIQENLRPDSKVHTMHALPDDVILMIKDMIDTGTLTHTVIDENNIAYTAPDNKKVDELLSNELYKDVTGSLDYYERKLKYSGAGEVHFIDAIDTVYIVDVSNKAFFMKLDEDGLTIHMSGEQITQVSKTDEFYADIVSNIMEQVVCPVILTEKEFESADRSEYISAKIPQMLERQYEPLLADALDQERKGLLSTLSGVELENPTARQSEALEMNSKWETGTVLVNESYLAKTLGIQADERIRDDSGRSFYEESQSTSAIDNYPDISH